MEAIGFDGTIVNTSLVVFDIWWEPFLVDQKLFERMPEVILKVCVA